MKTDQPTLHALQRVCEEPATARNHARSPALFRPKNTTTRTDASLVPFYVFDTQEEAEGAIGLLGRSGYDMTELSLVGKGFHGDERPLAFHTSGSRIHAIKSQTALAIDKYVLMIHGQAQDAEIAHQVLADLQLWEAA